MTLDRSHSDTVGLVVNPYFYVPKYPSSNALPVSEIFLVFYNDGIFSLYSLQFLQKLSHIFSKSFLINFEKFFQFFKCFPGFPNIYISLKYFLGLQKVFPLSQITLKFYINLRIFLY